MARALKFITTGMTHAPQFTATVAIMTLATFVCSSRHYDPMFILGWVCVTLDASCVAWCPYHAASDHISRDARRNAFCVER